MRRVVSDPYSGFIPLYNEISLFGKHGTLSTLYLLSS